MSAPTIARERTGAAPTTPRFDEKFIEDHALIERYLNGTLPAKGARELEKWCRANPDYLNALQVSDRAQASLKLLEAAGQAIDLQEPPEPWWRSPYIALGFGILCLAFLIAFWALFTKHALLRSQYEDLQVRLRQGSLVQPAAESTVSITPDRVPGIGHAKISVNRNAPQLLDVHVDMSFIKAMQFRMLVDKKDQGRALILENLVKDSNGELRLTLNTTGLAIGTYNVRIEALPSRGNTSPVPEGWLILEVH